MLDRAAPSPRSGDDAVTPVEGRGLKVARGNRTLLDVAEIAFESGVTAIIGPNGAGKSMLIKILAGLMPPDTGRVTWNGRPPSRAAYARLGLLLQHPVLLRRSALANVAYALTHTGRLPRHEALKQAAEALDHAGLSHVADTSARLLSGGEKQRLAMARALALKPEILFLDEPTASLDPASTLRIEEMVREARDAGTVIVLVTHDMAQARRLADTTLLLHRGRIVEHAPTSRFFDHPGTAEAKAFAAGDILI